MFSCCRRPPDRTVSGHHPHSRYTVERHAALVFDVRAVRRFCGSLTTGWRRPMMVIYAVTMVILIQQGA